MSDPVLDLLREHRPLDPDAASGEAASVRVLARLAVLEAGATQTPGQSGVGSRIVRAALAACACAVLWLALGPSPSTGRAPDAPDATPNPMRALALSALDGDSVGRSRLRHAGAEGRSALIEIAASGRTEGARALAVLRSLGAPRTSAEVERVAALMADPGLRAEATAFVASDLGPSGARALGRLLVDHPDATADAVAALGTVARRGRREDAFQALLVGAAAGRSEAAAAALRIGGAHGVERVLRSLPRAVAASADVTGAVERGSRTLRARIVRLAENGDRDALRVASAARLPEAVAPLEALAVGGAERPARQAIMRLSAYETVEAALALGRALDGAAAATALHALAALGPDVLDAVERRAGGSVRDASAALVVLAAAGRSGLDRVHRLAALPSLRQLAVDALVASPHESASAVLATLADVAATRHLVIDGLERRASAGNPEAVEALVALARPPLEQAVLRALARCGSAGLSALERVAENPRLKWLANELLERERRKTKRPAGRAQPGQRAMANARSKPRSL